MDGMWSLAVCVAVLRLSVPASSQDPSSTLFLISAPEVLHAGTPTQLAVTVLGDAPSRVVAEVAHGSTKVAQTEDSQGGLTRILTLPPIVGPLTTDSLLNLTVSGFRADSLTFTNTSTLSFSLRSVCTFIQTDRSRYQPGDTVRARIASVQLDNLPYKGRVDISVQDPGGNVVHRWESTGNLGIVLQEFHLAETPPLGQWAITATANGVTDEKAFAVEYYERPHFEVLLKTASLVLAGADVSGSVRAVYPSGQPVQGTLAVSLSLESVLHDEASPLMQTQTKEIYGSTQFVFSRNLLQALHTSSGVSSRAHVAASVTDSSTGFTVNNTVQVHLMKTPFQLVFQDAPPSLKPSLHFFTKLRISRYDRKPLSSVDLLYSAVIEVTQTTSTMSAETTTLTLPVPEDGNVSVEFELQDQVAMLFVRAKFQSSQETLRVYNNYSSPSGSYIQISPVSPLPAQIGSAVPLAVESTFQPAELHFVVSSRGQVVAAGTENSSSFSLTPAVSWSPEACVTVYCILSDGEVTSDTVHIPIDQHNQVSLTWSSDKAQPGEEVTLTVTTLEPGSQVAIAVMGTQDDALQAGLDLKPEQDCNIRMLTNARLYEKKQPEAPKNEGAVLMVERYWSQWAGAAESLLWLDTNVSDKTWTSGKITVPDGVTSLRAAALVMSDQLGLGTTSVPQTLTVSKDFSLSLDVPSHLIRGEEIVLEVNIINHLEHDIEVIVLLAQSEAFEFVLQDGGDVLVVNAQSLTLGSHVSASALFPIRPVALGEMDISVDAVSEEASDSLVWRVLVKPEGVEKSYSETLFLELAPTIKHNNSRSVSFSFPPDVVVGSQRAHMALVGDILALSSSNLDSLVQMPVGCGEQNMIHFAPSIYVLQYLDLSAQDSKEIRSRALSSMMEGYHRQLSFQRDDGSFSAFGASSPSGSTWLTAFVLRCFLQAQPYIQVDWTVLTRATTWLLKQQQAEGAFREVGRLIHTEMQGGLDNSPAALTAYVLIALLQDESYVDMYPRNTSLAQTYLEDRVSRGGLSNYSLCLVAYALALANSPVADSALRELTRRADYRDGVMMWSSSAGLESHDWQPRSAQIEMASYVLLALIKRGNLVEGIAIMKWLSKQRNHLGGYSTTQDTVVALQALAHFGTFSSGSTIDLRLTISTAESSSMFHINSTTFRTYQSQEINADKDLNLNIYMEGKGFALIQMNVFYNLESKAFSQNPLHTADKEAFSLHVNVTEERDYNHMLLSVCSRLKDSQVISQTGMVILDVGLLSGFSLSPGAASPTDLIRKVEILPEKVILYLDSLTKSEVCIRLPVVRDYKVAHVQDAVVQVYDYYEHTRRATRTYNSRTLHDMNSCSFCGEDCDHCRPGMTFTVSSSLSSHSMSSIAYSLICLFLAVTAFFIAV